MIDKLSLTEKADNTTQRKEMSGRVLRLRMARIYIYCWKLTASCCGNYTRSKGGSQATK